jgi:uncharacterized protein involved in outer membrane biogenesis
MALAVVLVIIGAAAVLIFALGAGAFRGPLVSLMQARFSRPIRVGSLQLQLWSNHPRIVARQVVIGNPPWVATGDMATIERVTLVFGSPGWRGATLESIVAQGATLHLVRDAAGRANWQRFDPDSGRLGKGIPLIRELIANDVHLLLDDELRHLKFDGTVSAQGLRQTAEPSRLHIQGRGDLNGRPATLELSGDPLTSARRDAPYAFDLSEQSSGSRADLHGSLPQPFDFNVMNGSFEATGADLADLRYLTGLTLVHTGSYRLTGNIARRGTETRLEQLNLTTGQSDISGNLSSHPQGGGVGGRPAPTGRPLMEGTLTAGVLHLADFGARAAGRPTAGRPTAGPQAQAPPDEAPSRLFSDAALNAAGLRRSDAVVRFAAREVDLGRTAVHALSGQMTIDHGIVTVAALRGEVMQGRFEARLKLDANKPVPADEIDMKFDDLQLASLEHKQPEPPLSGVMQVRIDITGHGASLHQLAASANGSISITVPHGMIRASLAELMGVDLRGLGLIVARSKRETAVRCAAAVFAAHDGTLTTQSLIIDTEPVLIGGEGVIHLDTESLDLVLRGEPKDMRLLRVDAPLRVRGTLTRPSVSIQAHDSAVKLIDPGHGKSVDCASLLAEPRP